MTIDLRFGRWQEVLSDVVCDALIVDAPYSERTHAGHDSASGVIANSGEPRDNKKRRAMGLEAVRRPINYSCWSDADVNEFVEAWSPRTRGWFVTITDHVLAYSWERALLNDGRYVFPFLPMIERGSRVRLCGDGPSNWTCWVVVAARPSTREYAQWGTLPAFYMETCERGRDVVGGKHQNLMRALVRDYSLSGDLICDPCAGGGTTLLAAAIEGRRAVGAECLESHYRIARKRIANGWTPTLFGGAEESSVVEQLDLLGGSK